MTCPKPQFLLLLLLFTSCASSLTAWDKRNIRHYSKHTDELRALGDLSIAYSSHDVYRSFLIDTIQDVALKQRFHQAYCYGTVSVNIQDSTVTFGQLRLLKGISHLVYVFAKTPWDSTKLKGYTRVGDGLYYKREEIPMM